MIDHGVAECDGNNGVKHHYDAMNEKRKAKMKLAITLHILPAAAFAISMAFGPAVVHGKQPSFYHYYYVYPESMTWCGKLVNEVFTNTNKNWHFTKRKVTQTTAAFSVGDERGFLRCLAKQPKESWVVIITTGNDSRKTKALFEELRLGVCGECSALVD